MEKENKHMILALDLAKEAFQAGEVPVGAVIVDPATNTVIATGRNETEEKHDPTAHAEMIALRQACAKVGSARLPEYDLYVTLEPCPMCAAALSAARIRRIYYGAYDPKSGGVDHGPKIFDHATAHHKPDVYGGIQEQECGQILKDFFKDKR